MTRKKTMKHTHQRGTAALIMGLALGEIDQRRAAAPLIAAARRLTFGSAFSASGTEKNSLGWKLKKPAIRLPGNTCCLVLYWVTRSL